MTELQFGTQAPDFNFPAVDKGVLDLTGSPFVVFFYPRAGTPGCTNEVLDFSGKLDAFHALGVTVVGVSPDDHAKLTKFRDKHAVSVDLVSDPDLDIIKRWGVWGEKRLYGRSFMGVERSSFLVDSAGKIAVVWRKVRVPGHAEAVLAAATALPSKPGAA